MDNVLNFIKWALRRAKKSSVPKGAQLPIPLSEVGSVTEAEYMWGTSGATITQRLLDARFKSYYSKNGWTRAEFDAATKGWVEAKKQVTDCQGLLDWYMKKDTNANGNYVNFCTDKGLMTSIKREYVIGEAVFNGTDSKKTHVGWICGFMSNGDPLVVEAQGLKYGVVVRLLKKRSFKYRGLMTKKFEYTEIKPDEPVKPVDPSSFVFTRQLKYGSVGDDVKELKKLLNKQNLGHELNINNPNFLGTTRKVVKLAQKALNIKVDGIAGPVTISALGGNYKA